VATPKRSVPTGSASGRGRVREGSRLWKDFELCGDPDVPNAESRPRRCCHVLPVRLALRPFAFVVYLFLIELRFIKFSLISRIYHASVHSLVGPHARTHALIACTRHSCTARCGAGRGLDPDPEWKGNRGHTHRHTHAHTRSHTHHSRSRAHTTHARAHTHSHTHTHTHTSVRVRVCRCACACARACTCDV
jgi:hypothetical protein